MGSGGLGSEQTHVGGGIRNQCERPRLEPDGQLGDEEAGLDGYRGDQALILRDVEAGHGGDVDLARSLEIRQRDCCFDFE